MLGFLGPNGAGKTTAMRAIFGLVRPDAGEVLWDGKPIGLSERLRFGYMPEERGLYPRMPVGEQLAYFGRSARWTTVRARAAATRWLERLSLDDRAEREGRGTLPRKSAARTACRRACCMSRSCSSSTSRAGGPSRSPNTRRGYCAQKPLGGPPSCSRAISSSSFKHLRGGCDHPPRPHRYDRARGLAQATSRNGAESSSKFEGAPSAWMPNVAGVELVERRNGNLRLLADGMSLPERVLADRRRSARVVEFNYGPPTLAELFLELVDPVNGRRAISLVARREIRERLRGRAFSSRQFSCSRSSADRPCSGTYSIRRRLTESR